jgi:NAD(P)-dependent dehydrogenase (short-subunit alcohol dehydrogenase family)
MKQLLDQLGLAQDEFENKVIVITGAGRGIGLQIAHAFAILGAKVVIAEQSEAGKSVEASIRAEGGTALFIQTDVSDSGSIANLAKETHDQFGPVDILVNNAIQCPVAKVMEMDEKVWDQVMAVNLRGTFLTCKAFLADMLTRKSGIIINMISAEAMPGLSAYIASKQGIVGFSQSLDLEVEAANIQVIPFGPGMVDTPGIRLSAPALAPLLGMTKEQFLATPLHAAYDGLMPAEHAGAATVYLAARLAQEFHGQTITGYDVLEKAGLLKTWLPDSGPMERIPPKEIEMDCLAAIEKLKAIFQETDAEFSKLPAFIRPMARAGFKSKSGLSLADWQKTIAQLASEMETGRINSRSNLPASLGRLINYYRDVPKETARFSKDAEFLQQVSETSRERIAVIETLIHSLG